MKNAIREWLAVGVVVLLGAVTQNAYVFGQADEPAETPAEAPSEAPAESAQVVTGLELEGELRGVDPDESIFLIVGENGNEMLFHYDDQTEVTGQTEGVQGLTGQGGMWVRIEYRAEGERAVAERIELGERGAEAESPDEPEAGPEL